MKKLHNIFITRNIKVINNNNRKKDMGKSSIIVGEITKNYVDAKIKNKIKGIYFISDSE